MSLLTEAGEFVQLDRRVSLACVAAYGGGLDEAGEEWVWLIRSRLKLGMGLGGDEEGMRRYFDDFDEAVVGRETGADQSEFR